MKLIGNLKKQVEKAQTRKEARDAIENAGMLLNDDELDQVAGGLEGNEYCSCKKPECVGPLHHQTCRICGKPCPPMTGPESFSLGLG